MSAHRVEELSAALAETRARGAEIAEALGRAEEEARSARAEKDTYAAEARSLRRERDRLAAVATEAKRRRDELTPPAPPPEKPRGGGVWWCQECGRGGTSADRSCPHRP